MNRFRQLRIHDRLVLALACAALLAFAVAGVALAVFSSLTLERRARQVMEPYAQLVAIGAETAVAFEDPVRAREILATLRANPQILAAEIILRDGRLLADYYSSDDRAVFHPSKADGVYLYGNSAELQQHLQDDARLRLVMNLDELRRQTRELLQLVGLGIFVLLTAVALGLRTVLHRAIVRPITTLAESVEQVRLRADYHQYVPATGAEEVARLGHGFNAMMAAIREREEHLQQLTLFQHTILDNAAYSIIATTPEGIVSSFNPAAERLLGYSANEVVGRETPLLWHDPEEITWRALDLSKELGETVSPGFDLFTALPRRGITEEREWTFIRKDGCSVPVILSVTALRNENGAITGFVGLCSDLTERKRGESEIRHLKNYLSNIIDSMPSMLVGLNRESTVTQWNSRAEAVTGISAAEAVGKPVGLVLPDYAPWIEAMNDDVHRHSPASQEKILIEKEGERRFYDLMLYPLVANGVEGRVLRVEDVTERSRIQEIMIQTEKMMSVGGLAAGMAHELNNPLNIITQSVQNLRRRISPELPANREAALETGIDLERLQTYFERREITVMLRAIHDAVNRAAQIIINILRFSRNSEAPLYPTDLAGVLEQALELAASDYCLKKKYDFRSIEIIRDYVPDMPYVAMVPSEMEQVFLNLLKNAAQAMAGNPPERQPRLLLRIKPEEGFALVEVEDNGPGMPEEVRRRVFEPFFTTKEPGIGTGLGLSVSYSIVTQNHNGLMEARSLPGSGACFAVRLPLARKVENG